MKTKIKLNLFKVAKGLTVVGLIGFLCLLTINLYVVETTKNKIVSINEAATKDYDCILILGAGVWANNVPSPILKDRLDKGIQLYSVGIADTLLMSGDHGHLDYDEVNVMKAYAIDKGINSSNIFMDHAGFSTYESLYRARDVFLVKKILIVTQKEHLYRALYIAESLGLDATGVAAHETKYDGAFLRDAREVLARTKDFFTLLIKPFPTYLGDPISIDSNGDLTNDY